MSPTAPVVRSLGEVTLRVYIWEHRIRSPSSFTYQTVRLQLFLPLSCDALGAPSEDVVLSPRHVLPAPLRWWPSLPFLHHIRGRRRWPISDDSPPPPPCSAHTLRRWHLSTLDFLLTHSLSCRGRLSCLNFWDMKKRRRKGRSQSGLSWALSWCYPLFPVCLSPSWCHGYPREVELE